jgi:hypothetical protein
MATFLREVAKLLRELPPGLLEAPADTAPSPRPRRMPRKAARR